MSDITPEVFKFKIEGYEILVDAADADLADFKWATEIAGSLVYFKRPLKAAETSLRMPGNKPIVVKLHRIILARALDCSLPQGKVVDHSDGNTLNNRRANLRLATYSQNAQNARRQKNNTSGYKGVTRNVKTGKWIAQIAKDKRRYYIGEYATPEAAYEAYCAKAKELFGEFARFE